jgi:hypothetical protein
LPGGSWVHESSGVEVTQGTDIVRILVFIPRWEMPLVGFEQSINTVCPGFKPQHCKEKNSKGFGIPDDDLEGCSLCKTHVRIPSELKGLMSYQETGQRMCTYSFKN